MVSLSAQLAAVIFFGKGFDQCRVKAQSTWSFFAVLTAFFCILEYNETMVNMQPLTIGLLHMVGTGGFLFYLSHMLFHSDSSEFNSTVAFFSLFAKAKFITLIFFWFNSWGSSIELIFLCVMVLITVGISRSLEFPVNDNERATYRSVELSSRGSGRSNLSG